MKTSGNWYLHLCRRRLQQGRNGRSRSSRSCARRSGRLVRFRSRGAASRRVPPACGRRAGKGHQVDIWMARQCIADDRAVAMNKVDHSFRYASVVQNLGGFQHHRASSGQRRGHIGGDQHQRPVPQCDLEVSKVGVTCNCSDIRCGAHFRRHRGGEVACSLLVRHDDPIKKRDALLDRR